MDARRRWWDKLETQRRQSSLAELNNVMKHFQDTARCSRDNGNVCDECSAVGIMLQHAATRQSAEAEHVGAVHVQFNNRPMLVASPLRVVASSSPAPCNKPCHSILVRRDTVTALPLGSHHPRPPICTPPVVHQTQDVRLAAPPRPRRPSTPSPPRNMARAYIASTSTTTTCLVSPSAHAQPPASPPPPTPYNLYKPHGAPIFHSAKSDHWSRFRLATLPARLSARMPLDLVIVPRAHWLSRARSCLRLLIIVLSGAVVCMLVHTLGIYRGNRYLDLRHGELPMTWPAHTNLAPTIVLLVIAGANFLASAAILSLSLKRSFRRPIRSRDAYRIIAGSFGVVLWITALVVFHLLDKASKASLGRYSCTHKNVLSNGRFQYRAVCEEQGVAFYTAIGAALAEILTLITLALSAIRSVRSQATEPTLTVRDKKHSISSGSQIYKPRKRSPSTL